MIDKLWHTTELHQISTFYRTRSSQFGSQWLKVKEEFLDQERVTSIVNRAPRVGNQQLLLTLLKQFAFIDRLVVLNGLLTWSRDPRTRFENVRRTLLICTFGFRSSIKSDPSHWLDFPVIPFKTCKVSEAMFTSTQKKVNSDFSHNFQIAVELFLFFFGTVICNENRPFYPSLI